MMALFKKRSRGTLIGYIQSGSDLPQGYTRLLDSPEISACINRIAAIVSSCPIHLMQRTAAGDIRVRDEMSRVVDIDPCSGLMSRSHWMSWIVSQLLGDGDGNCYLLPEIADYRDDVSAILPMPGASFVPSGVSGDLMYRVRWYDAQFDPSEIIHIRLFADETYPSKGRGYRLQARQVAEALQKTDALKQSLSNPNYKPPLAIFVNSDSDFSDEQIREKFRAQYLTDAGDGKPWILPADMMKVEQIKPLSLSDLAVKDTVELDKRTVCGIFGVPPFLLGLGAYSSKEYNLFVRTVIIPICAAIEQELTLKLLPDRPDHFFRFARRRLYDYDLATLIAIDNSMADRGYLNGDEVREDADRDPAGLTEFKVLENYIPYDMSGSQAKLNGGKEDA